MIKKHLKLMLITSIVILLPILAGVMLWEQLPQQMPFHWNAAGEVDGWASKPVAVFGMPLLLLALHWIAMVITATDPKKAQQSDKIMQLIIWLIPVVSLLLAAFTFASSLGSDLPIERFLPVFMGLLFVIIGNYLPKCKQSYTIGIKIPWTLHSEENWNKTHRLTGWLWVVCGLAMMVSGFVGGFLLLLPLALVMVVVPIGYSFLLYRKGV